MADFAQLEEQKAAMLHSVSGWSESRLGYRPAPGEWCVVEMLDHLERTESAILGAVVARSERPHRIGVRDRVGVPLLMSIFRSERRVKVPSSAAQVLPDPGAELNQVCARWTQSRAALEHFLRATPPASDSAAGVFRHPVGGWMSLAQVLEFFSVHMTHHGFQLVRLEKASQQA